MATTSKHCIDNIENTAKKILADTGLEGSQAECVLTALTYRKAERIINAQAIKVMRQNDITPAQFGVLERLYTLGNMSITRLIEEQLATFGNMTLVIKNMERDGLIERVKNPSDGRSFIISLTQTGKDIIQKVLPVHFQNMEHIFGCLNSDEQNQLRTLLEKITNSLSE